jgi:hypothetical protein
MLFMRLGRGNSPVDSISELKVLRLGLVLLLDLDLAGLVTMTVCSMSLDLESEPK